MLGSHETPTPSTRTVNHELKVRCGYERAESGGGTLGIDEVDAQRITAMSHVDVDAHRSKVDNELRNMSDDDVATCLKADGLRLHQRMIDTGDLNVVQLVQKKLALFMEPQAKKADDVCEALIHMVQAISTLSVSHTACMSQEDDETEDAAVTGLVVKVTIADALKEKLFELASESFKQGCTRRSNCTGTSTTNGLCVTGG